MKNILKNDINNIITKNDMQHKNFIPIENSDIEIKGYRLNPFKLLAVWLAIILTFGALGLVLFWKRDWYLKCTHSRAGLETCTKILVKDKYGQMEVENILIFTNRNGDDEIIVKDKENHFEIPVPGGMFKFSDMVRLFCDKRIVYLYDPSRGMFYDIIGEWLCQGFSLANLTTFIDSNRLKSSENTEQILNHQNCVGKMMSENIYSRPRPPLNEKQRQRRLMLFGTNNLHIPVPNFFKIMYDEVVTPFYAFQAFSVILWYNDDYYFYASCILIISLLTLIKSTRDIKRDREKLSRNLSTNATQNLKDQESRDKTPTAISHTIQIELYSDSGYLGLTTIPTVDLVPGDVIRIGSRACMTGRGFSIPCDAVLLNGSCIVDECMLTGESVPVTKTPIRVDSETKDSKTLNRENDEWRKKGGRRESEKEGDFGEMADEGGLLYLRQDVSLARHIIYNGTRILQIKNYEGFNENEPDNCSGDTNKDNNNIPENEAIRAYVISTGFGTVKGKMVTDFLYPAPSVFRFDQDSYKFVSALFGLALAGLCYSVTLKVIQKVPARQIIIRSLDLVAIVIPPALPAAMTAGLIFAQKRLKRLYGVLSLSPDKINVSGAVDILCFDKTGTLTEDGLDILGVHPLVIDKEEEELEMEDNHSTNSSPDKRAFAPHIIREPGHPWSLYSKNLDSPRKSELGTMITSSTTSNELSACCAVCHSLAIIGEKLVGDPLEIKMFIFSGWSMSDQQLLYYHRKATRFFDFSNNNTTNDNDSLLVRAVFTPPLQASLRLDCLDEDVSRKEDPEIAELLLADPSARYQYGVIHTYPFLPSLQRMSVVARRLLGHHFELYCKGAPEIIRSLCLETSIPNNFEEELDALTNCGYRVIACAHKTLHHFKLTGVKKCSRTQIEKDMTFIGFLIFQNKLKPQSTPTLDVLNQAGLRTVMVTGDNILTALSVAKECHLIPINSKRVYIVDATSSVISDGSQNNACPLLHITLTPKSLVTKILTTNDSNFTELSDGSSSTTTNKCLDPIYNASLFGFEKLWKYFECFSASKMTSDMNENKTLSNLSSLPTNQKSLLFFDPHTFYNRVRNFLTTFSRSSKIYITDAYDHRCNGFFNDRADTKCPLNMLKEDGTQGNVFVNHLAYEPISSPTIKSIISGENIEFLNDFNSNHIVYAMTGPTFETLENFYDGKTRHQIKITLKNTLGHKNGYLKNSNEFIIHRSIVNCDALDNFKCGNENHGYVHSKDVNNNNIKRKGAHLDDISNIIPDNTSSDILLNSPYTSNGISLPFCNDDLIPTLKKIDPTSPGHIMPFEFQPDLLDRLLVDGCCVFARMTPECKTRLVLRYQRLDYYVGMCGDGANDCGALKAAHMGISMAVSDSQPEEVISDKNDDKSTKKDIDIEGNVVGNNNGKITLRHRVKRAFRCSTPNDDASKMEEGAVGTASLAAPFTATHGNVSCVPGIIKEGRASLATSFCVFKNMACYSLNQFVAVLSLYWFGTNFSDVQFAFADFFPATVLTMLMGYTQANPQLPTVQALSDTSSFSHKSKAKFNDNANGDLKNMASVKLSHIDYYKEKRRCKNYNKGGDFNKFKPDTSLAQARHLGSVLGHIFINSLFLAVVLTYTLRQPWCLKATEPEIDHKNPYYSHAVAAVFILSFFQYLTFTVVFSKGLPFRRPYYTNLPLLTITVLLVVFWVYITLGKPYSHLLLGRFFKLKYPPIIFPSLFYLTLALCNFVVSMFFERILLDKWLAGYLRNRSILLKPNRPLKYLTFSSFSREYCTGQNM